MHIPAVQGTIGIMTAPKNPTEFNTMIDAVAKTFVIAHDQDTDEHLAQALVFNAGRLAWRMREAGVQTEQKTSISDVVTDADRAAERFVAGALAALRPEDGIVGEEGTNAASTSGRTWVVDPVDGTYNFSCGSDYWCSALALVTGDPSNPEQLHFGAVHRPAMGYTWFGGPRCQASARASRRPPVPHGPGNLPAPHVPRAGGG